jgi:hypothetical protein
MSKLVCSQHFGFLNYFFASSRWQNLSDLWISFLLQATEEGEVGGGAPSAQIEEPK